MSAAPLAASAYPVRTRCRPAVGGRFRVFSALRVSDGLKAV